MRLIAPASNLVRGFYILCLAGAAFNHARILAEHGLWWDYGGIHPFIAGFWTALTLFDSLAIALLLFAPRAGLALTTTIIVADVAVNACAGLAYGFDWRAFGAQALFLGIVLATVGPAWRDLDRRNRVGRTANACK